MPTAPLEVTGLDHIYVSVSDMARSEAFYDPVMEMLGFKKGTRPIAGEPHVHYFNRVMQYSLRPARDHAPHDPYRTGATHHLCFRLRNPAAIDDAWKRLRDLGVDATEPALYEYRPDYYATFFADPDGIRLELVSDSELRKTLRARWLELDGFVDPVSRLGPPSPASTGTLTASIPAELPDELIEVLARAPDARVERIVSRGHVSPPGFWYDQDEHELVVVIEGAARVELEGSGDVALAAGDWLWIAAHHRHRVTWTAPDRDTVWLAVFVSA